MVRSVFALLALLLVGTVTQSVAADAPAFAVGQMWSVKSPAPADLRIVVGRVEALNGKTVVHVSILNVPCPDWYPIRTMDFGHIPFDEATLAASIDKLVATDAAPSSNFEGGYSQWHEAHGGVFTIDVMKVIEIAFETIHNSQQSPQP